MSSNSASSPLESYEISKMPERTPQLFEAKTLILGILLGLLGVIIGLELQTRVGYHSQYLYPRCADRPDPIPHTC